MTGKLRVSPEKLISKSNEFAQSDAAVQSLTRQMLDIVGELGPSYAGEAASTYFSKLNGLQGDMEKVHKMIHQHTTELTAMARAYQQAGQDSLLRASSLKVNEII